MERTRRKWRKKQEEKKIEKMGQGGVHGGQVVIVPASGSPVSGSNLGPGPSHIVV